MKNDSICKMWIAVVAILLLPVVAQSQERDLQVNFDFASFRYNEEQVIWEFYYSLPRRHMNYINGSDGEFVCMVDLSLKVMRDDSVLTEQGWRSQNTIADTSEIEAGSILDRIKLLLEPGIYSMRLLATDCNNSSLQDSIKFNVNIEPIPMNQVALSDIELAVRIQRGAKDTNHPFYKNTLNVIPNPSRIYGEEYAFLYFYVETYNLNLISENSNYLLSFFVSDADGNISEETKKVSRKRSAKYESRVEWGALKVGDLMSGTYNFHVVIEDLSNNVFTEKEVRFFVFNPDRVAGPEMTRMDEESLFMASEFADMPEGILLSEFEKLIYITSSEQRRFFDNISKAEDKRRWLFLFWRSKDTNKATPFNEYRAQYMERVKYADENYATFTKEGWKSDRGRVLIMYGEPDYIERYPNTPDRKPGEIWSYNQIEGGVEFIFTDVNLNREYRLVHSNKQGEIEDPTYYQMYRER